MDVKSLSPTNNGGKVSVMDNSGPQSDSWVGGDDREPPHPWEDVPLAQWNDWRWQLSHRLNTVEDFARVVDLTPEEVAGLSAPGRFRVDVTPYFASLMDPHDPSCPIRRQVIPTAREMVVSDADLVDSLAEDAHSPVPGLVHRYPDRVLMLVTTQCASYCRFCTRSRIVGDAHAQFGTAIYEKQLAYIASTPQIRDVLLSGGDPLMMPPHLLEELLRRLREIPHVEVVRIGSRVPVFLPQRVTEDLVAMLRRYHPLWMNIHFNHPREVTPEVEEALARLADAGIPLGSQTVLMAGINDCPNVILALVQALVKNRVRPYYLYQCDLVQGASHFRTPVSKGIEVMEALRGHTSGFAIPTFVIDAPEGGGKVPVLPTYLLSMSDRRVVVRNYEGLMSTYTQPTDYRPHDAATCPYCRSRLSEGIQEGVAGLLAGHAPIIAPEQWRAVHQRMVCQTPASAVGSCFGGNGHGQPALQPEVHQGAPVTAEPVKISVSGSNGRGS
jgi:lysine 2,3-aminomutase